VSSAVRQGSVLSPALFTVFVNVFIVCMRFADLGCYINRTTVSCVAYYMQMTSYFCQPL